MIPAFEPMPLEAMETEAEELELERQSHDIYHVYLWEKLIINFAMPMDFVFHTFRALFQGDKTQTHQERLFGLWSGKVRKYRKLLRVKAENNGVIPQDYIELCCHTPCGRVRYNLTKLRNPPPLTMPLIEPVHRDQTPPSAPPERAVA